MTSEDLRSELDKSPFTPFRVHMVSGKTLDVLRVGDAWLMQNALMILRNPKDGRGEEGYDMVALRNIERIEQPASRDDSPTAALSE